MKVRLLGTSAGGGIPQWNCSCRCCVAARRAFGEVEPRSQSSVAVSADGRRWFLLNVSPDVRFQIEAFEPLRAARGSTRGTRIEGVLLTNADLDHTLGLLLIREGERLAVHATARVRASLEQGLRVPSLLEKYAGADWREPSTNPQPLLTRAGEPSGLSASVFPVPGKVPRYLEGVVADDPLDNVGLRLVDDRTGGRLVFIPDCARIDAGVQAQMAASDLLLFDGTFWSEGELAELGGRPAAAMAHQPVGGTDGTLAELGALRGPRRIYLHINNTNPILLKDSAERAAVIAAGVEVGEDGQELEL
jgi:pyrroloquinoline quinone biosynthesis protein B